jgi:tripartite-type tricarboxylate transporter receptor subunit TctC
MHLAGELMKMIAGIDMVRVTYKGCAPAINDAIGGRVPVIFNGYANVVPHAKAGRLRILGLLSATRSPVDASVPTIAEAGLSGLDADIWFAMFAPAGTPEAIVRRLNAEIRATLAKPDMAEKLRAQYFDVRPGTPEALAQTVREDLAHWTKVVKDANIRID